MYERVVENIVNGKCPHVDNVPVAYLVETGIYGIHIAAAVGTEEAIENNLDDVVNRSGQIFGQHPLSVALLKNNIRSVDVFHAAMCRRNSSRQFADFSPFITIGLFCGSRSTENKHIIKAEYVSAFEICARRRSALHLKSVLNPNFQFFILDLISALEIAFQNE